MSLALRPPFPLQDAWAHVGELYDWIVSLFGAPRALADRLILLRKQRHEILAWLVPVEALARRLLLLKALSLPKANTPPVFTPGARVARFADRAAPVMEEDAESWRVRFSVWPHGATRKAASNPPLAMQRGGAPTENALPLARRLEALRRVLENPEPALKRLTRLLAARRKTAPAAFAPYRPPAGPCATPLAEAQEELALAWNTS